MLNYPLFYETVNFTNASYHKFYQIHNNEHAKVKVFWIHDIFNTLFNTSWNNPTIIHTNFEL